MKLNVTDKGVQCPNCGRWQRLPKLSVGQFTCDGCKKTYSMFPYISKGGKGGRDE